MKYNSFLKNCIIVTVFFFTLPSIFSTQAQITINESSQLTKPLSGAYSLQASGTIEIHNPSNDSMVYESSLYLQLDSLLGISVSTINGSDTQFNYSFDKITTRMLGPNQTAKAEYSIYGLKQSNIYDQLNGESILEYYISDVALLSKIELRLNKPEREGINYDDEGIETNRTQANETRRLITTGITNPTDFIFNVKKIRIFRTLANNSQAYLSDGDLLKTFENKTINSRESIELDFFDSQSVDNSVYWLSSDVTIAYNIDRSISTQFEREPEPSGLGTGSGIDFGQVETIEDVENSLVLRKSTNKDVVTRGEDVVVSLTVINSDENALENLTLKDTLPNNYELERVSDRVQVDSNKLEFEIDKIDGYSSKTFEYTLKNQQQAQGVTYLQPAELNYQELTIYSEGVMLINELLTNERVFVQKEVSHINDEFSEVTIRVKNLGSTTIRDFLVVDSIDENARIRSISEMFVELGTWNIRSLAPGEEWSVTYEISRDARIDSLPNVFGVEQDDVYGVFISSEEVVTIFEEGSNTLEKIGLFVSLFLLLLYVLF